MVQRVQGSGVRVWGVAVEGRRLGVYGLACAALVAAHVVARAAVGGGALTDVRFRYGAHGCAVARVQRVASSFQTRRGRGTKDLKSLKHKFEIVAAARLFYSKHDTESLPSPKRLKAVCRFSLTHNDTRTAPSPPPPARKPKAGPSTAPSPSSRCAPSSSRSAGSSERGGCWGLCRVARAWAKAFLGTLPRLVARDGYSRAGGGGAASEVWGLNLATMRWEAMPALLCARSGHACCAVRGAILVLGGCTPRSWAL